MTHTIREVSLGGTFSDPEYPHYSRLPVAHPTVVHGFEAAFESRNIVHPILGSRIPDVTFREPALRSGTLELHFATTTEVMRAEQLHTYGQVLALDITPPIDAPDWYELSHLSSATSMFYVVAGRVARSRTTTRTWTLTVDYQEVHGPNTSRIWS